MYLKAGSHSQTESTSTLVSHGSNIFILCTLIAILAVGDLLYCIRSEDRGCSGYSKAGQRLQTLLCLTFLCCRNIQNILIKVCRAENEWPGERGRNRWMAG
jgi:hypothetical protein